MKVKDFVNIKGEERVEVIVAVPFMDMVNICVCNDIKKFAEKELKDLNASDQLIKDIIPEDPGYGLSIEINDEGIHIMMVLVELEADISTLVHETVHITHYILEPRGLSHNSFTDELYAYYQQWFFAEFLRKMS